MVYSIINFSEALMNTFAYVDEKANQGRLKRNHYEYQMSSYLLVECHRNMQHDSRGQAISIMKKLVEMATE